MYWLCRQVSGTYFSLCTRLWIRKANPNQNKDQNPAATTMRHLSGTSGMKLKLKMMMRMSGTGSSGTCTISGRAAAAETFHLTCKCCWSSCCFVYLPDTHTHTHTRPPATDTDTCAYFNTRNSSSTLNWVCFVCDLKLSKLINEAWKEMKIVLRIIHKDLFTFLVISNALHNIYLPFEG